MNDLVHPALATAMLREQLGGNNFCFQDLHGQKALVSTGPSNSEERRAPPCFNVVMEYPLRALCPEVEDAKKIWDIMSSVGLASLETGCWLHTWSSQTTATSWLEAERPCCL